LRIELFAGMGHGRFQHPQISSFRGARSANPESRDSGSGANAPSRNDGWLDRRSIKPPSTARPTTQTSCLPRRDA
jgi:hypothetical protein